MYTEHDERRGLVKTTWNKVRERVHKVNPEFAKLVDDSNSHYENEINHSVLL